MKNEMSRSDVMTSQPERTLPDYLIRVEGFDENTYWAILAQAKSALNALVTVVIEDKYGGCRIADLLTNLYGGKMILLDDNIFHKLTAEYRFHIATLIYFRSLISKPISQVLPMSPGDTLRVYSFRMEKMLGDIFKENIYK